MSLPEILIFRLNKTRDLAMLSRGFYDWEKPKVLVKSGSENPKPIRDGYTLKHAINYAGITKRQNVWLFI